jgi:hypothetical protein
MPTVHRFDGLRVAVYLNDHPPAHVHVIAADAEAVFVLNCSEGPPTLRGTFGFNRTELGRIANELAGKLAILCAQWSSIHGHY